MLTYFSAKAAEDGGSADARIEELGVSVNAIAFSLFLAFLHTVLEFFYLYIEAQAAKTSFINYCIVCFNGRFNWIPYNDYLASVEVETAAKQVVLDYGNVSTRILCFETNLEFHFTDETLKSLIKLLVQFP